MRREDFKEITQEHIETCKRIINSNGSCKGIKCNVCPFEEKNTGKECMSIKIVKSSTLRYEEKLLASAQEFLLLAENNIDKKIVGIDFKEKDNVNSPNHYKLEGLDIESIDVIFAVIRGINNGVIADCVGNILKYVMRAEKKNGLEDYKKARKYLDWCIEEKGKEEK